MRKNILTYVVACVCTALTASADTGFDGDITDWSYVENGIIYAAVNIENAAGVVITSAGDNTAADLNDGINTIKVPLSEPTFEVSAKDGYSLTVKVGDNTYVYADQPITVNCSKPAPVHIYASPNTSSIGLTVSDSDADVKYYDLNGVIVNQPQVGKVYIKVCAGEAQKVKF